MLLRFCITGDSARADPASQVAEVAPHRAVWSAGTCGVEQLEQVSHDVPTIEPLGARIKSTGAVYSVILFPLAWMPAAARVTVLPGREWWRAQSPSVVASLDVSA